MSITHPIGYPITHPTTDPKGYPNRGRIARIDSGRIESCRFQLLGSPSIHNVTQVTREAAPEQTVAPADEWMEDFDFEAEVPCDNPDCDRPADYVIRGHGSPLSFLACRPCRERLKPEKRWCPTNAALETADEHWEIVEVLR